jgi:carboxypeptidase Q
MRYTRFLLLFILVTVFSLQSQQREEFLGTGERILQKGLLEEGAYEILAELLTVGPRFAGSPGKAAAVELSYQMMTDMGLDRVWLEPVTVPRWIRGEIEEAKVVGSERVGDVSLVIAALGGSVATPQEGITAPVVEVHSFDELKQLGDSVRGKIVFFNRPMDRRLVNTFAAYSGAVNQRTQGAIEAAKLGAVAVLVRSITLRIHDYPHTGGMRYLDDVPQIPAAAISTKGAEYLSEILKYEETVRVFMRFTPEMHDSVQTYNVIGEITGSEYPDEIILIGAHLDSWDITPGAHDDGAGCAQVIQGLKLLHELSLRPKRTVRGVLFANEEFGISGGFAYADAGLRDGEKHLVAIESDRGGFLPLGFTVDNEQEVVEHFQTYRYLFETLGMHQIIRGFGGVDIIPLRDRGTIAMGLLPDSQRYFDVHHSAKDTLDEVHPRELELGAVAMALFAYVLAEEGLPRFIHDKYLSN